MNDVHSGRATVRRSRWAAIGAAVAVALGAGGASVSYATLASGERTSFVPITPCRLADTRPGDTVGSRSTPLGSGETYTLSARGTNGNCTLPAGATGVGLNVTAISPSASTFLTLWPTGSPLPVTSNLNPVPGSPPTPNSVTVDINASGQFNIYNFQGTVHVIVDVVGYYEDHTHDDRYYTKAETDDAVGRVVSVVTGGPVVTPTAEASDPSLNAIVTEASGRLLITKLFKSLATTCSAAAELRFFLTLDGAAMASSVQITDSAALDPVVLVGTTDATVAAGNHTVGVAAECVGAATPVGGLTVVAPGALTVLVLN